MKHQALAAISWGDEEFEDYAQLRADLASTPSSRQDGAAHQPSTHARNGKGKGKQLSRSRFVGHGQLAGDGVDLAGEPPLAPRRVKRALQLLYVQPDEAVPAGVGSNRHGSNGTIAPAPGRPATGRRLSPRPIPTAPHQSPLMPAHSPVSGGHSTHTPAAAAPLPVPVSEPGGVEDVDEDLVRAGLGALEDLPMAAPRSGDADELCEVSWTLAIIGDRFAAEKNGWLGRAHAAAM